MDIIRFPEAKDKQAVYLRDVSDGREERERRDGREERDGRDRRERRDER